MLSQDANSLAVLTLCALTAVADAVRGTVLAPALGAALVASH
jgi:hypothetical protein